MKRALAAAGISAAALAGGAAVSADGPVRVVAQDRDGTTVAEVALPRSGTFALAYRHSYYRRPAIERFRATGDGTFRLVEITSPSADVLDYYEVPGERTRARGWWTLKLSRPARFTRMALAATALGRRTLVADGRRVPLFRGDGRTAHLTIAVEGS